MLPWWQFLGRNCGVVSKTEKWIIILSSGSSPVSSRKTGRGHVQQRGCSTQYNSPRIVTPSQCNFRLEPLQIADLPVRAFPGGVLFLLLMFGAEDAEDPATDKVPPISTCHGPLLVICMEFQSCTCCKLHDVCIQSWDGPLEMTASLSCLEGRAHIESP